MRRDKFYEIKKLIRKAQKETNILKKIIWATYLNGMSAVYVLNGDIEEINYKSLHKEISSKIIDVPLMDVCTQKINLYSKHVEEENERLKKENSYLMQRVDTLYASNTSLKKELNQRDFLKLSQ